MMRLPTEAALSVQACRGRREQDQQGGEIQLGRHFNEAGLRMDEARSLITRPVQV